MADGFYSTDWENADQSNQGYTNQAFTPQPTYDQSQAYNPAQYGGGYQPGENLSFKIAKALNSK